MRELFVRLYNAFNQRHIDDVLASMHPEVEWPNGMEGGYMHGTQAVRDYWTRQWMAINPAVVPVSMQVEAGGRIGITVQQTVRDLNGALLADRRVRHVYRLRDGLIDHMEIRDAV